MILTHGANSLKKVNYGSVEVDGEVYKTLEYNGRLWTVENLMNDLGTNVYDSHGRYYKYYDSIPAITAKLTDGWRVPTKSDYDDLISFLGVSNPLDWISTEFGGTNSNGFDVPLNGYIGIDGLIDYGVGGYIFSTTDYNTDFKYNLMVKTDNVISTDYTQSVINSMSRVCVRICKDLT